MKNKSQKQQNKITVFYDGACGLCAKEINHYKKIAPQDVFEWIDITRDMTLFESLGYTKEQGLLALHALDSLGKIHIGVDAFILIWSQLKHWRLLGTFTTLPGIYHIAQFLYHHFARWRFKKLGYRTCQINKK